jgi:DNA ligase D-like protein (predicted ligase)/DNA ligase D-like protein (predicted 3'-phosphoesterase)
VTQKLGEYKRKRDFRKTSEPAGKRGRKKKQSDRFVVHEHHARNLHWDLRLERDGVLASWAVPKGIPMDPKRNHLAVHVEDHPLEYIDFKGEIPEGEYGAGKVNIWDSGTYDVEKWRDDEVIVVFHGKRLKAKYALFQTGKGKDAKNWMIHRMDPPADPDEDPMPEQVVPMMARLADLPRRDSDYGFEVKWDGVRAIAYCEGGRIRLESRTLRDVTRQYPELARLGRALGSRRAVLDGEIVALDEQGRPDFQRLQPRMHVTSESTIRRRVSDTPVVYMMFDVLWLEGHTTMQLPYTERRALLEGLELEGDYWRTPAHHVGDGAAMLKASNDQGLEGVVAKRLDSRYEPGSRSGAWLKIKNKMRQEFVIGGWLPGEGGRRDTLGSIAVGFYEDGRLRYAGNVGTGFTQKTLTELMSELRKRERPDRPFEGRQPPKQTRFVEPELVAEVEFRGWTKTRTLRQPSFKGLRDDKNARDVIFEEKLRVTDG